MEDFKTTLATFKVLVTDWDKFKAISKSRGETASSLLNEFIAQTIAAEENLPPKPSPDKFITQENLVAAIAPLVARIEALEKDDWGTAEQNAYERMQESRADNIPGEKVLEWLTVLEKGEPDIYTSEDREPINDDSEPNPGQINPDPTPPVDESPKSCFDLVGTVSKVAEVPAEKEQNLESLGENPDISDHATSEAPGTIPEKSMDDYLDDRGELPPKPWIHREGFETQVDEQGRFFSGQLVDSFTIADIYEFDEADIEEYSALERFKKEIETVPCSDGNLYRWIGKMINPMEETDD